MKNVVENTVLNTTAENMYVAARLLIRIRIEGRIHFIIHR
jgi:hypothetical protein